MTALTPSTPEAEAVKKLAWRFQRIMSKHLVIDDDEILGVGRASYEMARAALAAGSVAGPVHVDRDALGREVRKAWVRWAEQQSNSKPSWLVPYDELSEPDKEADRQIGEHIYALAASLHAQPIAPATARGDVLAVLEPFEKRAAECESDQGYDAVSVFVTDLRVAARLAARLRAQPITPAPAYEYPRPTRAEREARGEIFNEAGNSIGIRGSRGSSDSGITKPAPAECPKCNGVGSWQGTADCAFCNGTGLAPDVERGDRAPPPAAVDVPCRFTEKGCRSSAAAILYVPAGCHCWPDPVQALCHQHIETCESTGPITTIVDLTATPADAGKGA